MQPYTYKITKGDWLRRCMVSQLKESRFIAAPAPYPASCHVNQLWSEIISPMREEFIAKAEFEKCAIAKLECDKLYFPLEGEKVEYSNFWMQPHALEFGAEFWVNAPEAGEYPFVLATCGGVKVFVGGEQQAEFYSYLRNQERVTHITLRLHQGENCLYVHANDFAERDTQIYFKLQYAGSKTLQASLPFSPDMETVEYLQSFLAGLYLNRFNYSNPSVFLHFAAPLAKEITAVIGLEFTDAHTPTCKQSKTVVLQPGETGLALDDLIYRSLGLVSVEVSCSLDGLTLGRKLQFEYYDASVMQGMHSSDVKQRKNNALAFLARYGNATFQRALALLETGADRTLACEIIEEELYKTHQRYDCVDFRIPAFFYGIQSDAMPEQYKQKLRETLLNFRYWHDEKGNDVMWFFSENHALNFHVSEFLAGELMPEEIFTNSGLTGRQHAQKAKALLQSWFNHFFENGFNEWNSSVYIPIDIIGFLALYDMAADAEMKAAAKRALDITFEIFAVNSFKGIVAASYGRIYFKNLIGRRTGESAALNFIASGEGFLNQHCFSTVLLALSSYEIEPRLQAIYAGTPQGTEVCFVQGEDKVELYSYKTTEYIMASAVNYRPGQAGTQEHVFQVMLHDCDTQLWINHPGEAVYFGEGRPSYFAGNGTLPDVKQRKSHAMLTYNLLNQEVEYTHAFCPLNQFEQILHKGQWLFLCKAGVKLAIYAQNGLEITENGPLRHYELISRGKHNVWHVMIDDSPTTLEEYANQLLTGQESLLQTP